MMYQIEVDIIADVCPGQIRVTPPCWMNHEKKRHQRFSAAVQKKDICKY